MEGEGEDEEHRLRMTVMALQTHYRQIYLKFKHFYRTFKNFIYLFIFGPVACGILVFNFLNLVQTLSKPGEIHLQ